MTSNPDDDNNDYHDSNKFDDNNENDHDSHTLEACSSHVLTFFLC